MKRQIAFDDFWFYHNFKCYNHCFIVQTAYDYLILFFHSSFFLNAVAAVVIDAIALGSKWNEYLCLNWIINAI